MTQTAGVSAPIAAPIDALTVCEAFQCTAAAYPDKLALRARDSSLSLTWSALAARVQRLTAGLAAFGVERGDTVALLLPNTPECHLLDLAAVHLGAIPFTIYNSSSAEQIHHQNERAGAKVVFTRRRSSAAWMATSRRSSACSPSTVRPRG